MCVACKNQSRRDPTLTVGIQKSWTADLMRRWRTVQAGTKSTFAAIFDSPFQLNAFKADSGDIRQFIASFDNAMQREVIGSGEWQEEYIDPAYKRGMRDGSSALKRAGITAAILTAAELAERFSRPANADRVTILRNTAASELQGITSATSQQVGRVLRDGVAGKLPPKEILAGISDRIEHIGKTRSKILAKTETVRAHHKAKVQMYRDEGVTEVAVLAEWVTAGDDRVCPICEPMEGRKFTIDEIEGMIPAHAGCRCSSVPVNA
jgi:SPP1 gp7 family putative phage head morphogenesis protein